MKAYVINLPRSTSRREHITQQLKATGLSYELVDGVDGRELSAPDRAQLVDETAVARYPDWLTPGAIGCALSHLRTWERILEDDQNEIAIVFEDDVVIGPGIAETIAEIAPHMYGREVVLLYFIGFGVCQFSSQDAVTLDDDRRLMYPVEPKRTISASAYMITRQACQSLAESTLPIQISADSWGHRYESGLIDALRCVLPRAVSQRKDFPSSRDEVWPPTVRRRTTAFVVRHKVFPLFQVLTLNRRQIERRMSRMVIVDDRSPIAITREPGDD